MKPVIFGLRGKKITPLERAFFEAQQPTGFILFARNIQDKQQVKDLVADLKSCVEHNNCLILIDQEGGRVARLKPPHWSKYPPSSHFVEIAKTNLEAARKAVYQNYRKIGNDLAELGINVNCAPVLDIPVSGSDKIIGDRAFGNEPVQITILARAAMEGLIDSNILPILKHIPGHGRANIDSHLDLPTVSTSIEELERTDFVPFANLKDCPFAMTAHIKYSAIDDKNCATMSKRMISIIRSNIGFQNILMSDDLSMKALKGSFTNRTESALSAGCDIILHCNGDMQEMQEIGDATPKISAQLKQKLMDII